MKITDRQREVLQVIADFIQEYGYSPSVREIADLFFCGIDIDSSQLHRETA